VQGARRGLAGEALVEQLDQLRHRHHPDAVVQIAVRATHAPVGDQQVTVGVQELGRLQQHRPEVLDQRRVLHQHRDDAHTLVGVDHVVHVPLDDSRPEVHPAQDLADLRRIGVGGSGLLVVGDVTLERPDERLEDVHGLALAVAEAAAHEPIAVERRPDGERTAQPLDGKVVLDDVARVVSQPVQEVFGLRREPLPQPVETGGVEVQRLVAKRQRFGRLVVVHLRQRRDRLELLARAQRGEVLPNQPRVGQGLREPTRVVLEVGHHARRDVVVRLHQPPQVGGRDGAFLQQARDRRDLELHPHHHILLRSQVVDPLEQPLVVLRPMQRIGADDLQERLLRRVRHLSTANLRLKLKQLAYYNILL